MGKKLQLKRIRTQELCLILLLVFLGCSKDGDPISEEIAVKEIEIFTEEFSMSIGGTVQLNTVVTPQDANNPTVLWGTGDPDTAVVDESGMVTGIKKGEVTIFAISEENLQISDSIVLRIE